MSTSRRSGKPAHAARAPITMADLARIAGVSKITVSRALNENGIINPRTRERVEA